MRTQDLLKAVPEGQAFWIGSTPFFTLKGLHEGISKIDEATFTHHVNEHKNDFYNWTKDLFQHAGLSSELVDCHSKEDMLSCLESWLGKAEKAAKEQDILEKAVKNKVQELMEKPLDNAPVEVPLDPLRWYTEVMLDPLKHYIKEAKVRVSVKKDMLSPMYRISKKPSPEVLAKMSTSRKDETLVKNSVKQLFERQKYHPKNIPSSVPVPKLWELRPIKKLDKKLKIEIPSVQALAANRTTSVKVKTSPLMKKPVTRTNMYKVKAKTRAFATPRLKQKAVKVSHFPSTKSEMENLISEQVDLRSEMKRMQNLKKAQRTGQQVNALSSAEMIEHVKEVFRHGA